MAKMTHLFTLLIGNIFCYIVQDWYREATLSFLILFFSEDMFTIEKLKRFITDFCIAFFCNDQIPWRQVPWDTRMLDKLYFIAKITLN